MSSCKQIVFGSLALVALCSLFAFARSVPAGAAPAGGWEYHIVRGGIDLAASPQAQAEQMGAATGTLNQLGGEGWELVAIQGQFAVLKRAR